MNLKKRIAWWWWCFGVEWLISLIIESPSLLRVQLWTALVYVTLENKLHAGGVLVVYKLHWKDIF